MRYETRLGFQDGLEPTEPRPPARRLPRARVSTVSGARVRDELMDLLAEPKAPRGVERMKDLGLDRALHESLDPDPELVTSASLGALAIGADRSLAALAALAALRARRSSISGSRGLQLDAPRPRRGVARGERVADPDRVRAARPRADPVRAAGSYSGANPREALALALAMGAPSEPVLLWATDLSSVRLEISGADLLAAGIPEGPAIGAALEETLRRKLDGLVR